MRLDTVAKQPPPVLAGLLVQQLHSEEFSLEQHLELLGQHSGRPDWLQSAQSSAEG